VVQSVVAPLHDMVAVPDTVSVPLALSVYVLEVCVNTKPEGQPACTSNGQLKLPAQVAVEPDPVAVTLMPLPTAHNNLAVKLLPDTVISTGVAG
jgi:hypothetical protein